MENRSIFRVLKSGNIVAHNGRSLLVTHDGSRTLRIWELDEDDCWKETGSFTNERVRRNHEIACKVAQEYLEETYGY